MSVFTGLHRLHCSSGGRRGWAEHAPCTDSTARNTLTSKALLNPLIPEHDGQETCKVGLAGAIYPQAGQEEIAMKWLTYSDHPPVHKRVLLLSGEYC